MFLLNSIVSWGFSFRVWYYIFCLLVEGDRFEVYFFFVVVGVFWVVGFDVKGCYYVLCVLGGLFGYLYFVFYFCFFCVYIYLKKICV